MKLKHFNTQNTRAIRRRKPTIRFTKAGLIALSSTLSMNIGLKENDYVEFLQDEEKPKDWYIVKGSAKTGFQLRKYKTNGGQLITNSANLSEKFLESIGKKNITSIACLVATQPTEVEGMKLYAIITSSANA